MPALMGMRAPQPPASRSGRMILEPARRSTNRRSSKGYEYSRGQFLTFTPEELKALDVESSKIVDLEKFVAGRDIDPIYFDSPYYLHPDGPIAVEALRVIGAAMSFNESIISLNLQTTLTQFWIKSDRQCHWLTFRERCSSTARTV
jgi:Ku70/Ku80 beta-barrel domain